MPQQGEYLTLNGYPVPAQAGTLAEPVRSGEKLYMYDNSLASTENPLQRKRVWPFTTAPLPWAEFRPLLAILEPVGVVKAAGWAITRGGAAITHAVVVRTIAAAGALAVNVNALRYPMPAGRVLNFTGGKVVTLTADASAGDTVLTTAALPAGGLAVNDTAADVLVAAEPAFVNVLVELGEIPHAPHGDYDFQYSVAFKLLEV